MNPVLGLHAVAPGSNPVLASGQDLFLVVTVSQAANNSSLESLFHT